MDPRLIPLSALQHYAFCPRQCALIHNEQVWADNFLTAQGNLIHERVDSGEPESRKGIKYERGAQVAAPSLGLTGKLDLVECVVATGEMFPIEYKRGKPKPSDWDELQLCAQALCLEEMTSKVVPEGAIYHHKTRRRRVVLIDAALREHTIALVQQVRDLLASGVIPAPTSERALCQNCSLIDACQPDLVGNAATIARLRKHLFKVEDE